MSWRETACNAAGSAMDAARYMAFVSKCRFEIMKEKEQIRRLYTRLGKVHYKDFVTDEEPDEAEYAPLCDKISEAYRRINRLREEMADAKAAYYGEAPETEEEPVDELAIVEDEA